MEDLKVAKKRLLENDLTLVVVKDSKILFESKARGVSSFIEALDVLGDNMRSVSVADKVAGKAVALLCIYARVRAVYASILSLKAKQVFENYSIHLEWDRLVEKILDASGRDVCPFEKAATEINDPKDAYVRFKALLESLKSNYK